MNDRLTAKTTADLLSFIPHTLGSTPRESFVFLTLQGKQLGATLRIDAPATAAPLDYAQRVVTYLAADEKATGVLLAVYSDDAAHDRTASPYVETLIQELELANMPLKDAWLITSTHWRNLLCGPDCDCGGNQPLDSIADSELNATMVYRGSNYNADAAAVYAPFTGNPDTENRILAAVPAGTEECIEAAQALWRETLDSAEAMDETTAVRLVAAFQHVFIRDVLLCDIVNEQIDNAGKVLLGHGNIAPDWARVDKARDIARELIHTAPEGYRAPLLTLIGWLEFYKGRGSAASDHFALANHDANGYRLAELLSEVIRRGTVAGTAQNPDTAYRPQQ